MFILVDLDHTWLLVWVLLVDLCCFMICLFAVVDFGLRCLLLGTC